MTAVAFIGVGHMGAPMLRNLVRAGHAVTAYDVAEPARAAAADAGATVAEDLASAVGGAEAVVTMLPAGSHVRAVYLDADGVLAHAPADALLIDCSTIDVDTAHAVAAAAADSGRAMVDAPVSGGVAGAEAANLTFMVGGPDDAFRRAEPLLALMGRAVIHTGPAGTGQAAKICNNMMLGIQMLSVCEGFVLAERLGLDAEKLFEVASQASGQCWSLTTYCPVPGPVPASPANLDYTPGFAAAMMLKDLRLAADAARATGAAAAMGEAAESLFARYCDGGHADSDFSGIIRMVRGES